MSLIKGLHAYIYENQGERDPLSVLGPNPIGVTMINFGEQDLFPEIFEPDEDHPAAVLVAANGQSGICKVVPIDPRTGEPYNFIMKGFSYVATSDSRFSDAVRKLTGRNFYGAVALHDRKE